MQLIGVHCRIIAAHWPKFVNTHHAGLKQSFSTSQFEKAVEISSNGLSES
jgi:hypothetical protein